MATFPGGTFLPVGDKLDATARLRGWQAISREAVREADRLEATLASEGDGPVSELKFYTGRPVLYEPSSTRRSQYDLWETQDPGGTVLFLQPVTTTGPPKMCARAKTSWILMKNAGRFRWWVCER